MNMETPWHWMGEIVPHKGHGKLEVNGREGMLGFGKRGKFRSTFLSLGICDRAQWWSHLAIWMEGDEGLTRDSFSLWVFLWGGWRAEGHWIQPLHFLQKQLKKLCMSKLLPATGDFRRSSRKVHQPLPKKRFSMRWNVQRCALLLWWATEAGVNYNVTWGSMRFQWWIAINSSLASLKIFEVFVTLFVTVCTILCMFNLSW